MCIDNLGKEVNYGSFKCMVVGYQKLFGCLILSLPNCYGWTVTSDDDIILLHSPLNCSYVLADIKWYKEQLVL